MTVPDPSEWLTLADAAREIGMHRDTVAKHIRSGLMPGTKFGKDFRIPRVQWEQFKAGTWQARPVAPLAFVHRRAS